MKTTNYKWLAAGLLFIFPIAVFFLISVPAQASMMRTAPAMTAITALGNSAIGNGTSLNWSGYVASGGTYTSVEGTWNVPSVTAQTQGATQADAAWVGIGGINRPDLIQGGTQAIVDPSGGITYEAWYELLPQTTQAIPVGIHAGDSVTVSIAETVSGADTWTFSFSNNTTGQTYTATLAYASSLSSVEWVEEMPMSNNVFLPLDNFGMLSFAGGSTIDNGQQVSIAGADAQTLTMVSDAHRTLATPSPLGPDGASFTVTRSGIDGSTAPARGHGMAVMSAQRSTSVYAQLQQMLAELESLQEQVRAAGSFRR